MTNDVNDVCGRGYFRGVGPLKEGESASWKWDDSSYYVSKSATTMSFSKLILTYMNGTKQVLSKKMIKYGGAESEIKDDDDGMEIDYGNSESRLEALNIDIDTLSEEFEVIDNSIAEVPATYPGGEAALRQFVNKNFECPAIAQEQELQGTIILRFKVDVDGSVSAVKIEKSLSRECDRAAVDVVRKLSRFTPARKDGRSVPVWFRLPIRISCQ